MTPSELQSEEDLIFEEYKALHPGFPILPDGAADPVAYLDPGNFRILFVLKEGNDPDGNWTARGEEIRDYANYGGGYKTWANLACWSATIRNIDFDLVDRSNREWRGSQLRWSAFVNLKKMPGGSRSDDSEVERFALEHAVLLRRQLSLYKPHLTLACGRNTFATLEKIFSGRRDHPKEHEKVIHGFYFFNDAHLGTVIDFYHPQFIPSGGSLTFLEQLRPNLRYHFPERYKRVGAL
jgi:hypothetical protein